MINFTKSLVMLSAAAAILAAPLAHADTGVNFNSYQDDNQFLVGRNVTQNQSGFADSVTAIGGDEVEVAMYYHNTGGDQTTGVGTPSLNTVLKVSLPDAATLQSTHVIKGSITADNLAQPVTGTRTSDQALTVTSGSTDVTTTMAFEPGSVKWFPDRTSQTGPATALPNGQNGDSLITTGINIGTVNYCWQYSGYIHFKVKLTGVSIPSVIIQTQKAVRKAGTNDSFNDSVQANPGMKLEYSITARNVDGNNAAYGVRIQDTLPANETYVGPTVLHLPDGSTKNLADGITTAAGVLVLDKLDASETVTVTFTVATDDSIANNECRVNQETLSATNAPSVQATAKACFVVPSTPTPTPKTPAPPVTPPAPHLPVTGPGDSVMPLLLLSGSSLGAMRYLGLKRKLKKSLRNLDII